MRGSIEDLVRGVLRRTGHENPDALTDKDLRPACDLLSMATATQARSLSETARENAERVTLERDEEMAEALRLLREVECDMRTGECPMCGGGGLFYGEFENRRVEGHDWHALDCPLGAFLERHSE